MFARLVRYIYLRLQRLLRGLARSSGTEHQIALGLGIGMFIGMLPIVGIQMVVSAGCATLARANRLAAILPVWLTNPLTIVPIYSFNYWIGWLLVGGPSLMDFRQEFHKVIAPEKGMVEALKSLAAMGLETLLPLWLGCIIVGLVCAIPTYFAGFAMVRDLRTQLAKRRAKRHKSTPPTDTPAPTDQP